MYIELKNINKKFDDIILFDNYSLKIPDNKITGIFGPSGCGKTTLLNILGSIEKVDSGKILYNGKEIKNNRQKRNLLKMDIGFVFQNFGLIDNETVLDNLMILSKLDGMKKKDKIDLFLNVLDTLGLKNKLNEKIYHLSGGEQQRVALAKILLKDCSLILADEPTASLDWENKQFIFEQFRQLQDKGKTIVIVSHDLSLKEFCDKIIEFKQEERL
ncbi:MAG: ATP-binding cassette domain-containing protein [Beduini sp.]|uniref:ATP-binding cassette domain-containing protein n=1 Tax=Beduini sp. TaxID=1922300 RepID=UPI0011CC1E49